MEFFISDLLDGLTDADLDMQPHTAASARRIKELTMKKIHTRTKPKRRRFSGFWKAAAAAAIILSLAVPVMAATGFHFTDWLKESFAGEYDDSLQTGSASKNWAVSDWVVNLAAEDAGPTGLTLVYEEWNGNTSGSLAADGTYWLEKWDGSGYTALPEGEFPGEARQLLPNTTDSWKVSWNTPLESGSYRLGGAFTHTAESGQQETVTLYAKFRIFTQDMTPYVNRCKDAMENLLHQENWHLVYTFYNDDSHDYHHYTRETWRSGNDYLQDLQYILEDGSLNNRRGYLYRDGTGTKVSWAGDSVTSGIAGWEDADWIGADSFDLWYSTLEISDSNVGEVCAEGNEIAIIAASGDLYMETVFTLGERDQLQTIRRYQIPGPDYDDSEKLLWETLEVYDTSAGEIRKVIDAQDVTMLPAFSWQEEQHQAGKTGGFVNTAAQTITDAQSAITAAKRECTLEWQNTASVFYDEGADMWKVALGFSQDDSCQTVYMDGQGITKLVVTE